MVWAAAGQPIQGRGRAVHRPAAQAASWSCCQQLHLSVCLLVTVQATPHHQPARLLACLPHHATLQVGFGDVVAQTGAEVAIVILVEVLGVLFFALLISSISELLAQANRNARRLHVFRAKMQSVERWMQTQALPLRLQRRIKHFYAEARTHVLARPALTCRSASAQGGRHTTPRAMQFAGGSILAPLSRPPFTPTHPPTHPLTPFSPSCCRCGSGSTK